MPPDFVSTNSEQNDPEPALQIVRPNPDIALRSGPAPEMLAASTAEGELQGAVKTRCSPINPKDETEALLAAQMAAIHNATMVAARRLSHVETIPQQDSASNMLNKLARTFASQVEALKKYRSAGEQTIKVQHVTVNEGGQAIVGNVSQGGGGSAKNGGQPHEPCAAAECGPRCPATRKRSRHKCRAPAVRGWKVCRFHRARGGAPKGKANGAWQHGRFTDDAITRIGSDEEI